jgi:hypothetical protein
MKRRVIGRIALSLIVTTAGAVAQTKPSAHKAGHRPDLHGGGANPSKIPNHVTTVVTVPGLHLTGTTGSVTGVCALKFFQATSDNEIRMEIEGARAIEDKEDGCFVHIRKGMNEVHTYVVVDLTEAEWTEKNSKRQEEDKAKEEAYVAQLGKEWTLHFVDGTSEIYTAQAAPSGELPDFVGNSGGTAKIATTDDGKVMIIAGSCIRSGTLADGQVKDGTSIGECKPGGAWTAQMK